MKTYIVYVNGEEKTTIKASSHNAAEKKAQKLYPDPNPGLRDWFRAWNVTVAYTEV
jgi:hypothetical protein